MATIYDQTYVIDSNIFTDISILQSGLSSLNNTVYNNCAEYNNFTNTTNNNFTDNSYLATMLLGRVLEDRHRVLSFFSVCLFT